MANKDRRRQPFTQLVRAEVLPTRWEWGTGDTIAVAAIPAIFLAGWAVRQLGADLAVSALTDFGLRVLVFAVLVVANASTLRRHWRAMCRAPWRSAALIVAGLVAIQVIVTIIGSLLRPLAGDSASTSSGTDASPELAFPVLLLVSCGPMVTALIEDFVFRHTLLLRIPVWGHWFSGAFLVILNALLFGAIHINNFHGQWILTLTFAGAGLFMNVVYLWTRNIWHVLLMHGLNNFLLAGPVTVLLAHLVQGLIQ